MPRRLGRPGLLGTMARTAVVAGTATAVSGGMQRRTADRSAQQQQAAATTTAQQPQQPATDRIGKLKELGELKAAGVLTEDEFAAEKARLLAS